MVFLNTDYAGVINGSGSCVLVKNDNEDVFILTAAHCLRENESSGMNYLYEDSPINNTFPNNINNTIVFSNLVYLPVEPVFDSNGSKITQPPCRCRSFITYTLPVVNNDDTINATRGIVRGKNTFKWDNVTDIAIYKLSQEKLYDLSNNMPEIYMSIPKLCNALDNVSTGDSVTICGFSRAQTVNSEVNSTIRDIAWDTYTQQSSMNVLPHIVLSGPVNNGNSGGPVFTKDGRVLTIIRAMTGDEFYFDTLNTLTDGLNVVDPHTHTTVTYPIIEHWVTCPHYSVIQCLMKKNHLPVLLDPSTNVIPYKFNFFLTLGYESNESLPEKHKTQTAIPHSGVIVTTENTEYTGKLVYAIKDSNNNNNYHYVSTHSSSNKVDLFSKIIEEYYKNEQSAVHLMEANIDFNVNKTEFGVLNCNAYPIKMPTQVTGGTTVAFTVNNPRTNSWFWLDSKFGNGQLGMVTEGDGKEQRYAPKGNWIKDIYKDEWSLEEGNDNFKLFDYVLPGSSLQEYGPNAPNANIPFVLWEWYYNMTYLTQYIRLQLVEGNEGLARLGGMVHRDISYSWIENTISYSRPKSSSPDWNGRIYPNLYDASSSTFDVSKNYFSGVHGWGNTLQCYEEYRAYDKHRVLLKEYDDMSANNLAGEASGNLLSLYDLSYSALKSKVELLHSNDPDFNSKYSAMKNIRYNSLKPTTTLSTVNGSFGMYKESKCNFCSNMTLFTVVQPDVDNCIYLGSDIRNNTPGMQYSQNVNNETPNCKFGIQVKNGNSNVDGYLSFHTYCSKYSSKSDYDDYTYQYKQQKSESTLPHLGIILLKIEAQLVDGIDGSGNNIVVDGKSVDMTNTSWKLNIYKVDDTGSVIHADTDLYGVKGLLYTANYGNNDLPANNHIMGWNLMSEENRFPDGPIEGHIALLMTKKPESSMMGKPLDFQNYGMEKKWNPENNLPVTLPTTTVLEGGVLPSWMGQGPSSDYPPGTTIPNYNLFNPWAYSNPLAQGFSDPIWTAQQYYDFDYSDSGFQTGGVALSSLNQARYEAKVTEFKKDYNKAVVKRVKLMEPTTPEQFGYMYTGGYLVNSGLDLTSQVEKQYDLSGGLPSLGFNDNIDNLGFAVWT